MTLKNNEIELVINYNSFCSVSSIKFVVSCFDQAGSQKVGR